MEVDPSVPTVPERSAEAAAVVSPDAAATVLDDADASVLSVAAEVLAACVAAAEVAPVSVVLSVVVEDVLPHPAASRDAPRIPARTNVIDLRFIVILLFVMESLPSINEII